jgi:tyrosyl-tRNA synthetase
MEDPLHIIARGTVEIVSPKLLNEKLVKAKNNNRPLCVKAGFDPTAPDIHLGHIVLLRKLRQFQDLGHDVNFLIGDFTAQIGDPTGRDQLRPKMSPEVIALNARTYEKQVFKVLNPEKTRIVFNSSWLSQLTAQQMLELAAHSSVAQMLARADFKKRFEDKAEISLLEFFYPLLQGYDSVYLKADVELGGTDQKFNLLMGRQLQEAFGQEPQVVIMTPLLEGTDGVKKMSKSLGNYIGIDEHPDQIFGKVMSINDELMIRYYEVLTDYDLGVIRKMHPKEAKLQLGREIVRQIYGDDQARQAQEAFEKVFSQGELPGEMPEFLLCDAKDLGLAEILLLKNLVSSKNEFRRLLSQGAVVFEGQRIIDENWPPQKGILKIGKRRFLKLC